MVVLDAFAVTYADGGAFCEENGGRFFVGEVAEFVTEAVVEIDIHDIVADGIGLPAVVLYGILGCKPGAAAGVSPIVFSHKLCFAADGHVEQLSACLDAH